MKALFSLKRFPLMLLSGFLVVSCAPSQSTRERQAAQQAEALRVEQEAQAKKAELEKARVKANRDAANRRARLKKKKADAAKKRKSSSSSSNKSSSSNSSSSSSSSSSTNSSSSSSSKPISPPPSKYRTAIAIPGKPGFVFNPWTNKAVDVRGVPKGTLIRDPNDGNPDHKFRTP